MYLFVFRTNEVRCGILQHMVPLYITPFEDMTSGKETENQVVQKNPARSKSEGERGLRKNLLWCMAEKKYSSSLVSIRVDIQKG
mgnify:CR=1 FL=1